PWLDRSPVRSAVFRPLYKKVFWIFVAACLALGYVGGKPPEGIYVLVGQVSTFIYFAFFLIALPLLPKYEKTLPLPNSISEAVLKKG
ncbi:MAG: cytochrome C, partial [Alphaproteobacteria bacterium]